MQSSMHELLPELVWQVEVIEKLNEMITLLREIREAFLLPSDLEEPDDEDLV